MRIKGRIAKLTNIKYRSWFTMTLLCVLSLCMVTSQTVMAQNEDSNKRSSRKFKVKVVSADGSDLGQVVYYARFSDKNKAVKAYNELQKAITKTKENFTSDYVDVAMNKIENDFAEDKLSFKKSYNGEYRVNCRNGEFVLVLAGKMFVKLFDIGHNIDYSATFKDERTIRNINVKGDLKQKSAVPPPPIDGDPMSFPILFSLPQGTVKDDSRLTIHIAIVNCNTEDTVAYLNPIIFEGEDYHLKQDRRMAFDYNVNDSMYVGYNPTNKLYSNVSFDLDTVVQFKKPVGQSKTRYKAPYYVVVDDYHTAIYDNNLGAGTCLALSPVKFLDFSVEAKDIELISEFQEKAEELTDSVTRDLKLKFKVGSDELTKDSTNELERDKLIKELKYYGNYLESVTVRGGASPEGRLETNIKLAKKRQTTASNLLRNSRINAPVSQGEPIVFTWNDVKEAIKKRDDVDQSVKDFVSNIVDNSKPEEILGHLKKMPFYDTLIVPELENLRIMQVTYSYEREHIMDADEAVEYYYKNKHKLLSGKDQLSPGDYYNLYSQITDSAELDTITTIAYKTITSKPNYHRIPIAPYVCNKMSILNVKRGEKPDLGILEPFIDESKIINLRIYADADATELQFVYNRPEIVLNQAITYYRLDSLDHAYILAKKLNKPEMTTKMEHFINFSLYYPLGIQKKIDDPEKMKLFEAAEEYLLSSDYNKAILYTELKSYYKRPFHVVDSLIDIFDDANPKKWYLKGMLWEEKADSLQKISLKKETFEVLTTPEIMAMTKEQQDEYYAKLKIYEEEKKAQENGQKVEKEKPIPYYLAYFQHSFDLDRELKRDYFREGNVNEERRKSHPYKKKDIQKYRDLFKALIDARDAQRKVKKSEDEDSGLEDDDEADDDTTSGQDNRED